MCVLHPYLAITVANILCGHPKRPLVQLNKANENLNFFELVMMSFLSLLGFENPYLNICYFEKIPG